MKKFSISMAAVLTLLIAISSLNSCGDDGVDVCAVTDFEGEFVGKYWLLNLIPLTNNDTAIITTNGNTITVESALLGQIFNASYDPSTGKGSVSNENFDQFIIGGDTLFDISVETGTIELDASCNNLFVSLSGVTVLDGTVELPDDLGLSYPLTNASMNTKNGLKRQ